LLRTKTFLRRVQHPDPLLLAAASFKLACEPDESEVFVPFSAAYAQRPHGGLTEAGLLAAASLRAPAAPRDLQLSGLLLLIRP
jgi:hypothetical protein